MRAYPGFASAGERTEFLLTEHRLGELTGDDLTPDERQALLAALQRELSRVRRRAAAARLTAVGGVLAALAVAYALLGLGPTAHIEWFSEITLFTPLMEGPLWVLLVGATIGGLVAAEFGFRRGFRIGRAWSREATHIRQAITRLEANRTGLPD